MQTEKAKSSHFDRTRGFKNQIFSSLKKCQNQKYIFLAISFCEIQLKREHQPITKQYFDILPDFHELTFQEKCTFTFETYLEAGCYHYVPLHNEQHG